MAHVLAKDLREAVLQAAFEGKLTERSDSDSSVVDYLLVLQKRRMEYEKKYKDKKHKSLWESGDYETNFDIPSEWAWAYVGDIFRHNAGKALNAKNTKGIKRKYLTTSNVYTDHFELDNLKEMYYTDEEVDKCSVCKGDLLVLEGGDCGRTAIWNLNESYCIQNHLHRLRPFGKCNIKYFYYLLNFYKESGYLKGKGIAIQGLSANALHNIIIPIPSVEEQARIVAKVDKIMAKIDEYEKLENQLVKLKEQFPQDMKNSLLQAAIQGKITKQLNSDTLVLETRQNIEKEKNRLIKEKKIKREKLLPITAKESEFLDTPKNWGIIRLGEVINLLSGQDLTSDRYSDKQLGIPYITGASNFANGNILINRYTSSPTSTAMQGDLLITCKGTIGEMAYLNVEKAHIARQVMSISPIGDANIRYIEFLLRYFVDDLKSKAKSMIPGIDRKTVLNIILPFPPIEEQQRIVDKLDDLLPLVDKLAELN